jgi:hypothetical protein
MDKNPRELRMDRFLVGCRLLDIVDNKNVDWPFRHLIDIEVSTWLWPSFTVPVTVKRVWMQCQGISALVTIRPVA